MKTTGTFLLGEIMSAAHSNLRSTIDSVAEAQRILARFSKRDTNYVFTSEDLHSIRSASTMLSQGAKTSAELCDFIEASIWSQRYGKV